MRFNQWIDTFINEKGIDLNHTFEIDGPSGTNYIPVECIVDLMKCTTKAEQTAIKTMIVKIDFINGDVLDYFRHLAKAIVI